MDKEIWRCETQFMKKGSAFLTFKIFSLFSFFIRMQGLCQINYPKAENKPPKKTQFIILSTTNLPCETHQTANSFPQQTYHRHGHTPVSKRCLFFFFRFFDMVPAQHVGEEEGGREREIRDLMARDLSEKGCEKRERERGQ